MQGNNVARGVEVFGFLHRRDAVLLHGFHGGGEGIIGIDVHAEALGDAGDVAAHVSVGVDTQLLAFQLRAGRAVIQVAGGHHHQAESQFGHGVGVLSGRVHHADMMGGGRSEVYIVITCACTDNNLQLLGGVKDFGVHHIAADDEGVGIGHCLQQLGLFAIFLQQGEFIPCCFYLFADAVHGYLRERLVGCY